MGPTKKINHSVDVVYSNQFFSNFWQNTHTKYYAKHPIEHRKIEQSPLIK